jgi:methyl-accepting chemotaxis protein
LIAFALATIAFVIYDAAQKERRLVSIAVDAAAGEFSQWLRDMEQTTKTLSKLAVFKRGTINEISDLLSELGKAMPDEVEKVIYINKDGKGYYHTGESYDLSDRAYFRALMVDKSAESIVVNPFKARSTGNLIVAFVHTIKDDGVVKGLIFVSANVKKLNAKARLLSFGGARVALIDGAGRLFVSDGDSEERRLIVRNSSDQGFVGLAEQQGDIVGASTSGHIFYKDGEGSDRIMFFSPIVGSPDWTYGVSLDKTLFDADRIILLAALIVIALCSFIAALSIKKRN